MMKIYGKNKKEKKELQLTEIVLDCSLEEIQKLSIFLQIVKERHEYFLDKENECHTHYRDWDKEWDNSLPDIIIATVQK